MICRQCLRPRLAATIWNALARIMLVSARSDRVECHECDAGLSTNERRRFRWIRAARPDVELASVTWVNEEATDMVWVPLGTGAVTRHLRREAFDNRPWPLSLWP